MLTLAGARRTPGTKTYTAITHASKHLVARSELAQERNSSSMPSVADGQDKTR